MKHVSHILLIVLTLLYSKSAYEKEDFKNGYRADKTFDKSLKQNVNYQNRVHRAGIFWMNITNFGMFGNSWGLTDPCTGREAVSGDMPGQSGIAYLSEGSLWFGGYLDSAQVSVNSTNATIFQGPLVSTGSGVYEYTNELLPINFDEDPSGAILGNIKETSNKEGRLNCLFEDVYDPAASAEEQFTTMYTDKYPNASYSYYDKRSHIPLGVEVKQKSYSWSYKFAENFIILDYTLYNRNSDQKDIYDFFMGVYIDTDIGRKYAAYNADDICGFIQKWEGYIDPATGEQKTVNLNFAWSADNDGREMIRYVPGGPLKDPGPGSPLTGATGVATLRVLRNPNPNLKYSFNYFSSYIYDEKYDWGPRWKTGLHSDWQYDLTKLQKGYDDTNYDSLATSYWHEYFSGGITEGTPIGDRGRYMVMSNDEYDYDLTSAREVYLGIYEDPPSLIGTSFAQADKWQPWIMFGEEQPGEVADGDITDLNDKANGIDQKYILSFGPLGDESYVNLAVDSDHDSLQTADDTINKKVWKFAYGDSLKLTLAFIVSEDFHTSVDETARYPNPDELHLWQGVDTSFFENGWYDAYFNVVWAERVYDQPMYDTPVTINGETKTDGWFGEDIGADGIYADIVKDPICWWTNSVYQGIDEGEGDFKLTEFTNEFVDNYGHTATSEDDLLPYGREQAENDYGITGSRDTGEGFGLMVKYPKSDGLVPQGTWVRYGYGNGVLDVGDGVPDYKAPPPPPSPKIKISYQNTDVTVEWSSHEFYEIDDKTVFSGPEHVIDSFSGRRDFEGYQILLSKTKEKSDFEEIYTVDKMNYTYENVVNTGEYLKIPVPLDTLLAHPDDYPSMLTYAGKIWQLIPFKENNSLTEYHEKQDAYTYTATKDSIELDTPEGTKTEIFYNYKFTLHNKLYGMENYIAVTASDQGDPITDTASMKSNPLDNCVSILPSKVDYTSDVIVFPNPYRDDVNYEKLRWENTDGDQWGEQDRRIMFMNIPERCVIRIYTLAGDLCKTIAHNGNAVSGIPYQQGVNGAYWNFVTENQQAVVSGIYLFSVQDVDSDFEFVGKFVIIK